MDPLFKLSKRGKVPLITWPDPVGEGGTRRALVQFCEHFDSARSDVDMIARHMQQAVDEGAPILKMGDTFDACGGRYDPRRTPEGVRQEFVGPDYLDRLVNGYATFAAPYARNIALMGRGNHELSIMKHCDTDLISRTAERLRQEGSPVITTGIGTWLICRMYVTSTTKVSIPIWLFHDNAKVGGAAKGVAGALRRGAVLPEAAVVITGGGHNEWQTTVARERLNERTGRIYRDEQIHFSTSTYRHDWSPEGPKPSWHSQEGRNPRPIGGSWLELSINKLLPGEVVKDPSSGKARRLPMWKICANVTRAK